MYQLTTMGLVNAPAATAGYPTSGDARQAPVNHPAQVRIDAANLRQLDFPAPDTGNAYDPAFRAAVKAFQTKAGVAIVGPIDGLIGPRTRAALEDMVRSHGSAIDVSELPAGAALPGTPGASGAASNVSAGGSSTTKIAMIVGGAAVAIGLGWYLLK